MEELIINKVINNRKSLYIFFISFSFPPTLNNKMKKWKIILIGFIPLLAYTFDNDESCNS